MGIFGNILNKILHYDSAKAATKPATATPGSASTAPAQPGSATPAPAPAAAASSSQPAAAVDVGVVLETMAAMKSDHGGNYKSSIVDLLKLLDLESSLSARKELADELGVRAGADGSADQNIALHRAVMDKLAANGGIVPDSLRQ